MQYGVCGSPEISISAVKAQFDYFEWSVTGFLKPLEDNAAFRQSLVQVHEASLPCPVLNLFVPGHLKITGPEASMPALKSYVETACQRAEIAGVKVIVFGSGGARNIPDGFPRQFAWDQLLAFCQMAGRIAGNHGVKIAIEPLNRKECNVINSITEGTELAQQVGLPSIGLLVDAYHWAIDDGTTDEIVEAGRFLTHAHIATRDHRKPPGAEEYNFAPFFKALHQAGYNARISIEGTIENPELELPEAFSLMQGLSDD